MRTHIEIKGLRLYAYHGVMEQERKVGNFFEVSLRIEYPFNKALDSDNLNDTANYALITEIIKEQMAIPSKLLEHVAGRIIKAITKEFPQTISGKVSICKLTPPISAQMQGTSIIVEW